MILKPILALQIDEEIQLRLLELSYAREYAELTKQNQPRLRQWEPWASNDISVEGTESFIKQQLHEFAEGRGLPTSIWYQGQMVGSLGLHHLEVTHRRVSLGYWIDAAMEGKGIVTRAARGMINYAFSQYNVNKIDLHCVAENVRSRAVAERLGFQPEGRQRQHVLLNEKLVDILLYGLLLDEWRG